MVLKINLGKEREKRLSKHLEKEHPSTKGKMNIDKKKSCGCKIFDNVPDFEQQARDFTKI